MIPSFSSVSSKVLLTIALCGSAAPLVQGLGWGAQLQQEQEANAESVTRSIGNLARRAGTVAEIAMEVSARKNARVLSMLLDDPKNESSSSKNENTKKNKLDCDYADPNKIHMCPPTDKMNHPEIDARSGRWAYIVQDKEVEQVLKGNRQTGKVVLSPEVYEIGQPRDYAKEAAEAAAAAAAETPVEDTTQDSAARASAMTQVAEQLEKETAKSDAGTERKTQEAESPLVLFARCLDDPDDPACKELQGNSQPLRQVIVTSPTSARGLNVRPPGLATESPTKDDCYGHMWDERFCASSQPSLSISPSYSGSNPPTLPPVTASPTNCEDLQDKMFLIETQSSDEYVETCVDLSSWFYHVQDVKVWFLTNCLYLFPSIFTFH